MLRRILCFLLSIAYLLVMHITASSESTIPNNLLAIPMDEDAKKAFVESVDLQLLNEQLPERTITCFDVSASGLVAVAFDGASKHFVQVYNQNGVFLYGYEFNSSGIYGIEFIDDNIGIYFVRSNVLGIYEPGGQCIEILDVPLTDSNKEIMYELPRRIQKNVAGLQYKLERDFGFWDRSYSRLIVTDVHGQNAVFYDATTWYGTNFIMKTILVCSFGIAGVIILAKKNKYYENEKKTGDGSLS